MSASWDLYGLEPDLWLVGAEGTDEERFIARINLPDDAPPALRARRFAEVRLMKAAPAMLAALEATLSDLDFLHDRARLCTDTVDADIMDQAMTRMRAVLRAAKGEPS